VLYRDEDAEIGQKLRYKDYQLMKKEEVDTARMSTPPGDVEEITSVKDLGAILERDERLYQWWRVGMGYGKGD
jgi:hypothetical protein